MPKCLLACPNVCPPALRDAGWLNLYCCFALYGRTDAIVLLLLAFLLKVLIMPDFFICVAGLTADLLQAAKVSSLVSRELATSVPLVAGSPRFTMALAQKIHNDGITNQIGIKVKYIFLVLISRIFRHAAFICHSLCLSFSFKSCFRNPAAA